MPEYRSRTPYLTASLRFLCGTLIVVSAAGGPALPGSLSLFSSANPAVLGQPLTLTGTVPSGATGKVTFYDGASVLGIATVTGGHANLTTSLLPSGLHALRAHYSGDATYRPGDTVTSLPEIVNALQANAVQQVVSPNASSSSPVVADFNGDGK